MRIFAKAAPRVCWSGLNKNTPVVGFSSSCFLPENPNLRGWFENYLLWFDCGMGSIFVVWKWFRKNRVV